MCSKKVRNFQDLIETDSHECATIILGKVKNQSTMCFSNLHRRNYCPVNKEAVAVQRSDWPRAK